MAKTAMDGANYTRVQKGHSIVIHILLCFVGIGLITIPYYSLSPNHYWHLQQIYVEPMKTAELLGSLRYIRGIIFLLLKVCSVKQRKEFVDGYSKLLYLAN